MPDHEEGREQDRGLRRAEDRGRHRQTSFARSPEHRRKSFAIEDSRWAARHQLRDWAILAALLALTIGWSLLLYFLEPGLR